VRDDDEGAGKAAQMPVGWPREVRPPGAPGWERSAVAWLLDVCPPDYRAHPVVTRQPVVLAWLAGHHLQGQLQATRNALATARADLTAAVPPPALRETLEVVEEELARVVAAQRALGLVAQALRGVRYVPRL
jgi:hypothetical protein